MFLAVDAGTSSVKGVLASRRSDSGAWAVLSSASRQLPPPVCGADGSAEQDTSLWWEAAAAVLRELLPSDEATRRHIRCISSVRMRRLKPFDATRTVTFTAAQM